MYIGKLNDRLSKLNFGCYILGTDTVPDTLENGNPLVSEQLFIDWRYLLEKSVELKISWQGKRNINDVVLHLGDDCTPKAIKVRNIKDGALLCSHLAETGENINKRELILPVEAELEGFTLEFDTYFSSVVVSGIEIYGADFDGVTLFPEPSSVESGDGSLECASIK